MMACSMACAAWQRRELVFQLRANSRHCFSFSGDRSLQSAKNSAAQRSPLACQKACSHALTCAAPYLDGALGRLLAHLGGSCLQVMPSSRQHLRPGVKSWLGCSELAGILTSVLEI